MSKDLKAKVTLDVASATKKLDALAKHINRVNAAVNKTSSQAGKMTNALNKTIPKITKAKQATDKWANSASKVNKQYQKTENVLGGVGKKLKGLAATYLGVMGAQAVIGTADIITSAENKLTYANGGDADLTQETMDKVYAAAQRSRGEYTSMLSDVSKLMTLANDSFQNNTDNAIRFQEIMSKAYTIGGASAAEQASSMYQLVQALGSGVLQGDELRSVREGAPIAYKKIEEFAQGVLNTEESLKDLASQGYITSDIIVAAIMNAESEIENAFNNTKMTFDQAFNSIKNTAVKAFEPVLQQLNKMLNSDGGRAIIDGIEFALVALANVIIWVMDIFGRFFNWCADNWYWLQWVVAGVVAALVVHLGILAAQAVWAGLKAFWAFITGMSPLYVWIVVIGAVVAAIVWLANTAVTGCNFIFYALLMVAAGLVLVALLTQTWWLLWVALAVVVVALIIKFIEQIVGAVYWLGAVCYNIGAGIANFFVACFNWIMAAGYNAIAGIANFCIALYDTAGAVAQNIGIAFSNAWNGAMASFWDFIASCVEGLDWLAKPLSAIAELFGESFDYESFSAGLRNKADTYAGKQQDYVDVGAVWDAGMSTVEYQDLGDAWANGMNTFEYKDLGDAYNNGAAKGAEWSNAIGEYGNNLKEKISGFSVDGLLENILNTDKMLGSNDSLPDPNNPAYSVGGAYDPSGANDDIQKALDDINGNTDAISDKMDLTDDDLEYLRRIAEMEWKKEFTTATVKVDMSNYNTLNGDADLDGIVEKLADKLQEELDAVANGVYA